MSPSRLRWLVVNNPELQVYFEVAHEGVKGLTDKKIIEGLINDDPEIIKMVFNKMYAGRQRGGYNIAELGTVGYKDPLAKELAEETEQDRKQGKTVVEFTFVNKDVREQFAPIQYVDAEIVEEGDDEEEKSS
jgi:cell division GTPase FtsZ